MQCSVTPFPAPSTLLNPERKWKWNGFQRLFYMFYFAVFPILFTAIKNYIKPYLPMRSISQCQFSFFPCNFIVLFVGFISCFIITPHQLLILMFAFLLIRPKYEGEWKMKVIPRVSKITLVFSLSVICCYKQNSMSPQKAGALSFVVPQFDTGPLD